MRGVERWYVWPCRSLAGWYAWVVNKQSTKSQQRLTFPTSLLSAECAGNLQQSDVTPNITAILSPFIRVSAHAAR